MVTRAPSPVTVTRYPSRSSATLVAVSFESTMAWMLSWRTSPLGAPPVIAFSGTTWTSLFSQPDRAWKTLTWPASDTVVKRILPLGG